MAASESQTPGWIWLLSGLVIGLFVAFLVYVENQNESLLSATDRNQAAQATVTPPEPDNEDPAPTKFEFYKLLPKEGIKLPSGNSSTPEPVRKAPVASVPPKVEEKAPVASIDTRRDVPAPTAPASVTETRKTVGTPSTYIIQVGSFRRYEDADSLKAKLAFSGIVADIASVTLANGQEWHRVRIGPSGDMGYLNDMQATLKANDFSAMLMKMSK